jgi:hypothetical protein
MTRKRRDKCLTKCRRPPYHYLSLSLNSPLTLHLPLLCHYIDDPYYGQRLKVGLDRDYDRVESIAELQSLGASARFVSLKKCERITTVSSSIDSRDKSRFPPSYIPTGVWYHNPKTL